MSSQSRRLTPLKMARDIPGSNHARLLQLLHQKKDLSRADLARAAGFTKATVSSLISEMIDEGLVVETRQRTKDGPGRPAVGLDIDRKSWCVLAVDLSPDREIRGALVDLSGEVFARSSVEIGDAHGEDAERMTLLLIDELRGASALPVLGIGISTPGIVDLGGHVVAHNLGWNAHPLREHVEVHTGLPTSVANDANIAALAEKESRGPQANLMLVKISHGIGAGIIADGNLIHGSKFTAGEIGHVAIGDGEGPLCVCGRRGCLEATLTLPKLQAQLASAPSPAEHDAVLRRAGARLGIAAAPLVGGLGLETVVVSGLPPEHARTFLPAAREALEPRLMPELLASLDLRLSLLGEDIELKGAVSLVLTRVLGIV